MSNESPSNFQARLSHSVMELGDISEPGAPVAVGLSAATDEITRIYGER
jgi:hypothetical protein